MSWEAEDSDGSPSGARINRRFLCRAVAPAAAAPRPRHSAGLRGARAAPYVRTGEGPGGALLCSHARSHPPDSARGGQLGQTRAPSRFSVRARQAAGTERVGKGGGAQSRGGRQVKVVIGKIKAFRKMKNRQNGGRLLESGYLFRAIRKTEDGCMVYNEVWMNLAIAPNEVAGTLTNSALAANNFYRKTRNLSRYMNRPGGV